jgi:hypothetical protein
MTSPQAIAQDNPIRMRESHEGHLNRCLSRGMRTAFNEGIRAAESLILEKQKRANGKEEDSLSNLLIELHEQKVAIL